MKKLNLNFVAKFTVALIIVGAVIGCITHFRYNTDLNAYFAGFIDNISNNRINTFLFDISALTGILAFSVSIVLSPLILFYLFYEGFSCGYTLAAYTSTYGSSGTVFYLLYFLMVKALYLAFIIYFTIMSIKFIHKIVLSVSNKDKETFYIEIKKHFMRYTVLLGAILINSTLIYLISSPLAKSLLSLLK